MLALPIAPCRGVGCIQYEMATGRPLFPGSTVKEELHLIFRLLGQSPAAPSISPRGGASTPSSTDTSWDRAILQGGGPGGRSHSLPPPPPLPHPPPPTSPSHPESSNQLWTMKGRAE